MKYTIEDLKRMRLKEGASVIYFWGHHQATDLITQTCLSQWYPCKFIVDNKDYYTAEQYMMSEKAKLFKDYETYIKIMKAKDPREYKSLGRKVKGFDALIWDKNKYDIVLKGNIAKFSQNSELKKYLLSTGNSILAEASSYDRIWGIGMDEREASKLNISYWKGENLLGLALMEARDTISNGYQEYNSR